jgi:heterotetrameric sarcosine oxidase gamma subunit
MANLAATIRLHNKAVFRTGFNVEQNNDFGLIRLQTFHRRVGLVDKVAAKLGMDLPGMDLPGPGEIVGSGELRIFWSAPGEWVIALPAGTENDRLSELQSKLDGLFVVLTLMTDSRVAMNLGGEKVRDILARGSSVNFHATDFGINRCLSTRFAGVPVMLVGLPGNEFLLFACRSVAIYLFDWFQAASRDC